MMKRRLLGLMANLLILAIIIGMPIVLMAVGGNPIPAGLPSIAGILDWLTSPDDGTFALTALILGGWLVWAFLTIAIAAELVAAIRGIRAPLLPGLQLPQHAARRLVATAALLFIATPTAALTHPAEAVADIKTPPASASTAPVEQSTDHSTPTPSPDAPGAEVVMLDHIVEPGDNLSDIAETHLGDPYRWPEIYATSQGIVQPDGRQLTDPDVIDPGWTLKVSTGPAADITSTVRNHIAQPGDTLSGLAHTHLGDPGRWPELYAATLGLVQPDGQRLIDPDLIGEGWTIRIPGVTPDPAATESESAGHDEPTINTSGTPAQPSEPGEQATAPAVPAPPPARQPAGPSAPQSPTTTSQPAQTQDLDQDDDDELPAMAAPWLLTGFTGGVVLSASAFLLLGNRRRQQFRERRPGRMIATPPPVLAPVEKSIHVVGSKTAPTVQHMDEALRRLAQIRTAADLPMPKLLAVELAPVGLTLHLAEPLQDLAGPWLPADETGDAWRLPPDADLAAIGYLHPYQPAPYPLLVTCGTSDDGHPWLLNLEQSASVQVAGDPDYATDFLRYLLAELAVNPWSRAAAVTCVGLGDDLSDMNPDRLTIVTSIDEAVQSVLAEARDTIEQMDRLGFDTASARGGEVADESWGAHALVIAANGLTPTLEDLVELTDQHPDRTGVAIVLNGLSATTDARIHLTETGRVTVDKLGLDLVAVGLTSDEARGCAALLAVREDTQDTPIPVDTSQQEGWRALVDEAGAIREELTVTRATPDKELPEDASSLISDELPLPNSTLEEDLEQLAPKVPARVRTAAELADQTLDEDVADWFSDNCTRPRLALLGPVTVRAHGKAITKRKPFYTEVLSYIALREHGATPDEVATGFGYTNLTTIRTAVKTVRDWLGTNPRTGRPHLPPATESEAGKARGIGVYQVEDLILDVDLFCRLRLRGQARGVEGIEDLRTALRLVRGRPFDQLRPGGWSWLIDTGTDNHMICAIADVAHLLVTHFLQNHDLEGARKAAETAILAAPYDNTAKLDLAEVTQAEGHTDEAQRIRRADICNDPDDDGMPAEVGTRTQTILTQSQSKPAHRLAS